MVEQGAARRVDLKEATEVLKLANQHGLIHLTIYNPEQHVYALCSCCECCCHDIEFMKKLGGMASGVDDRVEHNRAGMKQTLAGVAAAAAEESSL